jgi:tetratricopeptide (TPR) repeat protein
MMLSLSLLHTAIVFCINVGAIFGLITLQRKVNQRLDLKNLIQQTNALTQANNLTEAMELLEKALVRAKKPPLQAAIIRQQGRCLLQQCQARPNKATLNQAVTLLQQAFQIQNRLRHKKKQAVILNDLAKASLLWSEFERKEAHLDEALHHLRTGLTLLPARANSKLTAALRFNLGLAYHQLAQILPNNQRENLHNAIAAFTAALTFYTPKRDRSNHDLTELNLSICYKDLYGLEPTTANINRAVQAAKNIEGTLSQQKNPLTYARLQLNYGQINAIRAEMEHSARNRLIAYQAFRHALRVFTIERHPLDYANTRYELAKIYLYYDKRPNRLDDALASLKEALKVFDQNHYPSSFSHCQFLCSTALIKLAELEHTEENLASALDACEKVLKTPPGAIDLFLLTGTYFNIGLIRYRMADYQDTKDNITQAVQALNTAFEIKHFTSKADSLQAHQLYGAACRRLATLDPTLENLKQAVNAYHTLTHLTQTTGEPGDDAHSHAELGNSLRALAQVQAPVDNLQASIANLEQALELYQQQDHPQGMALTTADLGRSYLELSRLDESGPYLDKAIALFIDAEKLLVKTGQTVEHARVRREQGFAYQLLATKQDKAANLAKAAQAFQASIKILPRSEDPEFHAVAQQALGLAYYDTASCNDPEFNLTKAARAFEKALELFQTGQSGQRAQVQVNYGKALLQLADFGNDQTCLTKAIKLFETALNYYRKSRSAIMRGTILNHLGVCYQRLFEAVSPRKSEYLKLALEALMEALKLFPSGKTPLEYAMTQNNLGATYSLLATVGNSKLNINLAIQAYETALKIFTPATDPQEHQKVKANLAKLKSRFNLI